MYNRYIPQPDGSFRRSRVPDAHFPPTQPAAPDNRDTYTRSEPEHREPDVHQDRDPPRNEPPKSSQYPRHRQRVQRPVPHNQPRQEPRQPMREPPRPERKDNQLNSFFRNLLPKDFDTTDLLIVLLLLLMAGDCQEDQNSALLTLALYFFM